MFIRTLLPTSWRFHLFSSCLNYLIVEYDQSIQVEKLELTHLDNDHNFDQNCPFTKKLSHHYFFLLKFIFHQYQSSPHLFISLNHLSFTLDNHFSSIALRSSFFLYHLKFVKSKFSLKAFLWNDYGFNNLALLIKRIKNLPANFDWHKDLG